MQLDASTPHCLYQRHSSWHVDAGGNNFSGRRQQAYFLGMKDELKKYLAEIGSKGGKKSRRTITPAQQAAMQEARKAARLRKEQND